MPVCHAAPKRRWRSADQLSDNPDVLKAMVLARDVENARLTQIVKELQRHRFGRRTETLPEDQLLLGLEEAEQIEAAGEEASERAGPATRRERTAKRRSNRGCAAAASAVLRDGRRHREPCLPMLRQRISSDRRRRQRAARHCAARVSVVRRPNMPVALARTWSCRRPPG